MALTYAITAERNGMALLSTQGNELKRDTKYPLTWRRKRDFASNRLGRFVVPTANLVVANTQGQWSHLQQDDLVTITSTQSGTTVTEWTGRVDRIRERDDGTISRLVVRCIGSLGELRRKMTLAARTNTTPNQVLTDIFDDVELPAAFRGTLDSTVNFDFPGETDVDGLVIARKVEITNRGLLLEDKQGRVRLESFSHRSALSADAALPGIARYNRLQDHERAIPAAGLKLPPSYLSATDLPLYVLYLTTLATTGLRLTEATWYARHDEARAQTLDLGQVIPVDGENHIIEGLEVRLTSPGRRRMILLLQPYSQFAGRFILDQSLLDGPDVLA